MPGDGGSRWSSRFVAADPPYDYLILLDENLDRAVAGQCSARSAGRDGVADSIVAADPPYDYLILFDENLDRAVAGPVFGVDRVVLDSRVQPQPVALLAVVEGALQGAGAARGRASPAASTTPAAPARGRLFLVALDLSLGRSALRPFGSLAFGCRLSFGPLALGLKRRSLELGGDQSVVLGAEVDLVEVGRGGAHSGLLAPHQIVLAPELLDLLHGDLELVGYPRIGATLTHPGADLVELWSQ
jgi:hypothetical protein